MAPVEFPNEADITAFDRGYMLGYVHCLEQIYMALTEGDETNLFNLHPSEQAKRISVLIEEARKELPNG